MTKKKTNCQRILLRVGERLEIAYSKLGYKKHYSSIGLGAADQERCPEQQTDTTTNVSFTIIGPCRVCLYKS
jgi:hypothetical protein